jgi:GNAT superfamily N-acetyltransferase
VERLVATDWERWRDVRFDALRDAPDAFGSTLDREAAFTASEWIERLSSGPVWLAVDDTARDDVGLVACGTHAPDAMPWVYSMWVAPAWRGGGTAELLLGAVVEFARANGATMLGLDVTDRAPRAQRFYERFGFVVRGEVQPLPRDPSIQLIEMAYDLATPSSTP